MHDFHNGGRSARPGENSMKTRSQRPRVYKVLRRSDEGAGLWWINLTCTQIKVFQGLSGLSPSLALSSFASLISNSSLLIPAPSLSLSFFLSDLSDFSDFFDFLDDDFSGDFDRDLDR